MLACSWHVRKTTKFLRSWVAPEWSFCPDKTLRRQILLAMQGLISLCSKLNSLHLAGYYIYTYMYHTYALKLCFDNAALHSGPCTGMHLNHMWRLTLGKRMADPHLLKGIGISQSLRPDTSWEKFCLHKLPSCFWVSWLQWGWKSAIPKKACPRQTDSITLLHNFANLFHRLKVLFAFWKFAWCRAAQSRNHQETIGSTEAHIFGAVTRNTQRNIYVHCFAASGFAMPNSVAPWHQWKVCWARAVNSEQEPSQTMGSRQVPSLWHRNTHMLCYELENTHTTEASMIF